MLLNEESLEDIRTKNLHKLHMAEERRHMEVGLAGRIPSPKPLVGKSVRGRDGAEKVHPPPCALGLALVHIEHEQRDAGRRDPRLGGPVQHRGGSDAEVERRWDADEGGAKGRAPGADLGRVEDEGVEGDVVGADLELEVGARVVVAGRDEGLHDLVLVDWIVDLVAGVEMEVRLVEGGECDADRCHVVAQLRLGEIEVGPVRHRLVVRQFRRGWAGWHVERGHLLGVVGATARPSKAGSQAGRRDEGRGGRYEAQTAEHGVVDGWQGQEARTRCVVSW